MFFRLRKLIWGKANGNGPRHTGIMRYLARSKRAATLPMMAAAIIPLIGIIGGAVDMTRIYLVKTRMQQACDGGALAARRSMAGMTMTSGNETTGENFFNANLRNGAYGVQSLDFVLTNVTSGGTPTGAVHGRATANLPLTLMRVFFRDRIIALAVDCEANLNISNNDVMFVLDTTGSMGCVPADSFSTCQSYAGSNITGSAPYFVTEKSNSRIDGLRTAVENFVVTLRNATPSAARLRIGFLSYSSEARVGFLLRDNVTNAFKSTIDIPTKVANFNTAANWIVNTSTVTGPTQQIYSSGTGISQANCTSYGNNNYPSSGSNPVTSGVAPSPTTSTAYSNNSTAGVDWGWAGAADTSGTTRSCRRRYTVTNTTYTITQYSFTSWGNATKTFNVAGLIAGTAQVMSLTSNPPSGARTTTSGTWSAQELADKQNATPATASGLTLVSAAWDGCIRERDSSSDDIDTAPTSDATRWSPVWAQMYYTTTGNSPTLTASSWTNNYVCPKDTLQLFEVTQADTTGLTAARNYVNVLNGVQQTPTTFLPHGRTYHDIGMIWGTRLMSTNGLFSSFHGAAPNGRPVNRHIIFMTDGDMDTGASSYSVRGFDGDSNAVHNTRFLAACQAAKDRGISVWVVSFAQALTTNLTTCADSGQAFQADNAADLNTMFQTIAQRIAELRLTS